VTVLVAEATSRAEQTHRGDGDAERNRIFADAYGKDPTCFYRSMQAYEEQLAPMTPAWCCGQIPTSSNISAIRTARGRPRRHRRRYRRRHPRRQQNRPAAPGGTPMDDFLAALGLVFVIEGLLFAAFPDAARRAVATVLNTPDQTLRTIGIASAVLGLAVVWLVRG
jgi:uncharacterized protein YjeT (DUF2065 family)